MLSTLDFQCVSEVANDHCVPAREDNLHPTITLCVTSEFQLCHPVLRQRTHTFTMLCSSIHSSEVMQFSAKARQEGSAGRATWKVFV